MPSPIDAPRSCSSCRHWLRGGEHDPNPKRSPLGDCVHPAELGGGQEPDRTRFDDWCTRFDPKPRLTAIASEA